MKEGQQIDETGEPVTGAPMPPAVPSSGLSNAEVIALALSALWLLAVTIFFFVVGVSGPDGVSDPLRGIMVIFAVFMPIGLIWIATIAAGSARTMRAESARLQEALDQMRRAYISDRRAAQTGVQPSVEKKLDAIVAAQRETGAAIAMFSSTRPSAAGAAPQPTSSAPASHAFGAPGPVDASQPSLGLHSNVADATSVSIPDFITAMNFPKTADDEEGFRALKRAMQDKRVLGLIQASQDILTLLSQEGIYMDDMKPDQARPELWRRFAQGERGRPIAALGGIRDRSGIALTAARMRQDHVFRDAAHHFLRNFDKVFVEFERHATDTEVVALSETRTARAFMLLGRVAGTFD